MNNKLLLAAVVSVNAALVTSIIGCRSTTGMEADANRSAYNGTATSSSSVFSGFPGETGASGFDAGSKPAVVKQDAPAAPVAAPARPASAADEPMGAPGTTEPAAAVASEPVVAKTSKVAAEPATAEEPKAVGSGRTYVVKSNDSLWVIARREHVTIDELTAANGIKRNAALKPGQKLVIPASSGKTSAASHLGSTSAAKAAPVAASGNTYTVVSGDALSIVARKLHTTTSALRAANPQLSGDNLRIGQKLNVPSGAKAAAAAPAPAAKAAAPAAAKAATPAAPVVAKPASNLELTEITTTGAAAPTAPAVAPAAPVAAPTAPENVDATPVSR